MRRRSRAAAPSLPYEDWLIKSLKDRREAAAYLEAAIEDGDQAVLMLALRHVAQAQGGVAEIARRAELTREIDFSGELDGEAFEPLRDPAKFATAYQHPVMRTVAWANGADLAPEFLLELMRRQREQAV